MLLAQNARKSCVDAARTAIVVCRDDKPECACPNDRRRDDHFFESHLFDVSGVRLAKTLARVCSRCKQSLHRSVTCAESATYITGGSTLVRALTRFGTRSDAAVVNSCVVTSLQSAPFGHALTCSYPLFIGISGRRINGLEVQECQAGTLKNRRSGDQKNLDQIPPES
jgi:hypothetical protein